MQRMNICSVVAAPNTECEDFRLETDQAILL